MKKSTKIWFICIAIALLVAGLVAAMLLFSPSATAGGKTIELTVAHSNGTTKEITVKTDEAYLAPALLADGIVSGSQEAYGLFIDTVDGEYADPDQNQWWVFTVNGEMGVYGADTQPIADGDRFDFSIYAG